MCLGPTKSSGWGRGVAGPMKGWHGPDKRSVGDSSKMSRLNAKVTTHTK